MSLCPIKTCIVFYGFLCIVKGDEDISLQTDASGNSKFNWKKPSYVMPWLKGPNVCAVEEVDGTRKQFFSDCMPVLPRKVCQKNTYIRLLCCTGYEQTEGEDGCRGVKPMHDLMVTAKHLYLKDFRENIRKAGLEDNFKTQGPYTIFAPHNSAFAGISDAKQNLLATQDESLSLLRLHVLDGRRGMRDLRNGDRLTSLYYFQDRGELKINRYTNGITTVNCVRIMLPDQPASNGVVHVIEEILEPHSTSDSIMDLLLQDDRFGEFVTALITSDASEILRDKKASFTVFAPTDAAFRNAPPEVIDRILQNKQLVRQMLEYHILQQTLCTPAIIGSYTYQTIEGQRLNLTCDVNEQILVNDIPVSERDLLATNGVIHVLNTVLIPDSVKAVGDILNELDLGQFIEFAQAAGLGGIMNGETPGNFTVFVPSSKAFHELDKETRLKILTDSDFVRRVISYHIVTGSYKSRSMTDGMSLATAGDTPLRITIYRESFGVGPAKIISPDHVAGNGVIHVIDRVLLPPEESALQKILLDTRLKTFYTILERAGLMERLSKRGHLTVLAPTDEAFSQVPPDALQAVLDNPQELSKVVNFHVLQKPVFTSNLKSNLLYRYNTLADEYVTMEKSEDVPGQLVTYVGKVAKVLNGDIESTTGVVHVIDEVLRCPCSALLPPPIPISHGVLESPISGSRLPRPAKKR